MAIDFPASPTVGQVYTFNGVGYTFTSEGIWSTGTGTGVFQPLDADLTAIAALTGIGVIYYRSAADTWGPVTVGSGLTFAGGTLACTVSSPAPATVAPIMDGVAAVGTSLLYARQDHVHPSDTSLAPLNSPALTGTPTAPTPAVADNSTKLATTAFVKTAAVASLNGNAGALTLAGTAPVGVTFAGSTFTWTVSVFGSAASGIVPASGGGTNNFLRADGAWAVPASAGGGFTTVNVQTFSATGTYTPSAGMKFCTIECVGGGGGGGGIGDSTGAIFGLAGGGSGGYSRKTVGAATVGASQAVTIGALGVGGTAGGGTGGNGGVTSVGTLCVANGGTGGVGSSGSSWLGGAGGVVAGAVGDVVAAGNPGGDGASVGTGGLAPSGHGGGSFFGGGGRPAAVATTTGSSVGGNASNYGAGGGGAAGNGSTTTRAGGNGSPGFVIITEYI
jgi:hypothetical protein